MVKMIDDMNFDELYTEIGTIESALSRLKEKLFSMDISDDEKENLKKSIKLLEDQIDFIRKVIRKKAGL